MRSLSKTLGMSGALDIATKRHTQGPGLHDGGKLIRAAFLVLVMCVFSLAAQGKYGGGTGEPNDPYLIFDANQMNAIGANPGDWDKHFLLCADIDLGGFTGPSFNIIGTYYPLHPFIGVFDGNGHTISNFTWTSTGRGYIGLFGYVSEENAEIRNLGVIGPNVDAGTGDYVGSLVGCLGDGTITDCYVESGSVSGHYDVGGLVGRNYGTISNCHATSSVSGDWLVGGLVGLNWGTITNCCSTASVSGEDNVGGMVGSNLEGTITNCYSTGSVSGDWSVGGLVGLNWGTVTNCCSTASVSGEDNVGGMVGRNGYRFGWWLYPGTISNCYSTGSVEGDYYVGGLVGFNWDTIFNCYSTASVDGDVGVGGLVGYDFEGDVTNSFWDIDASGQASSDGGTDKTTGEMKMMVTFTNAGWDFVGERINGSEDIWMMTCEGMSYPKLNWWQPVLGDYFCPDGVDMIDMEHLALHWLDTGCDETNDYCDRAEISNDSSIDFTDFAILADNWLAGR